MALPARDDAEAEAVALGGLLGGYASRGTARPARAAFGRATLTGDGTPRGRRAPGPGDRRGGQPGAGPGQHRALDLPPATLAAEAEQVAADRGLEWRCSTRRRWPRAGTAASPASGRARCARRGWSGSLPPPRRDEDRRVRRQGHHVRLRRAVAQAAEVDGDDEVATWAAPPPCSPPCRRSPSWRLPVNVVGYLAARGEHAGRRRAAAVRRHHDLRRQDRRGAEHRRRGPAGAGRRHRPVRRGQARPDRGRRHAHRRARSRSAAAPRA